jgi:NTE family protein
MQRCQISTMSLASDRRLLLRTFCFIGMLLLALSGCAYFPTNAPLKAYDPHYGYRPINARTTEESGSVFMMLSFSGGGTRAAALAYGVLEELRRTEVMVDGRKKLLLDEVDAISGVSGGSFTAAYYGLFGDRIFRDFEAKFLKRDVEGALMLRVFLNPFNWVKLLSPTFDRSNVAAEYYNQEVFEDATFADMATRKGPMIFINATDMIHGTRVAFTQEAFDIICSDLAPYKVGRACAASSAVPVVLAPVTLKNYAGTCGYEMPEVLKEAMEARVLPSRRFELANDMLPFLDSSKKPYIHLIDGGVADNLGVRALISQVTMRGDAWTSLKQVGLENVRKIVFVVVNAQKGIDTTWDHFPDVPSLAVMLSSFSTIAIARYNTDTLDLLRESFDRWTREIRQGRCAPGNIVTEPGACGDIQFYLVEVDFDALKDEAERDYFKLLPTPLSLQAEEVDRLRGAAGSILRESTEFHTLLEDLKKDSAITMQRD